jgi:hypothetical protein
MQIGYLNNDKGGISLLSPRQPNAPGYVENRF